MKFSRDFADLIDFIEFTHEFREVIRIARTPHADRYENDVEHSYQLAMVAWYIIETKKLKLNKERCLMYALAHDLVEVYAGDTPAVGKTARAHDHTSKHAREKKALIKIKKRFPKFKTLISMIEKYEKRSDNESKFIYALDKILPPIQIYLEKGRLWYEHDVGFDELLDNKNHKIAVSKTIDAYWQELKKALEKDRKKLFPK